jgi:Flp pilus assembly protein TadG
MWRNPQHTSNHDCKAQDRRVRSLPFTFLLFTTAAYPALSILGEYVMTGIRAKLQRYLDVARRFGESPSGSVAIIFGLLVIVVCGCIALSLDYGRAVTFRSRLQSAVDAAALAANPLGIATPAEMQANVAAYFNANTQGQTFGAVSVAATATPIADGVRVTATATVPTKFAKVLGISTIPVSAVAEAVSSKAGFEVSLVLDNTYSMVGSKLDGLKSSAKSLVDQVVAVSVPGSVKFGLVPFSNYVNVGKQYRGATWLSVPNDSTQTTNQCWWDQLWKNCTTQTGTCYNDGVPYSCSWSACEPDGPPFQTCGDVTSTSVWNGCVGSRTPQDLTAPLSAVSPAPGIMNVACPSPLARLTNDDAAIKAQIDGMIAQGETYIPSGLIWGWRTLSPDAPFADATGPNANPRKRKIMILMTDGENTKSQNGLAHDGTDAAAANATTAQLCSNIKNEGISLYVIAFTVTSPQTKSLLQSCATNGGYFYDAVDSAALQQAFSSIAGSLTKLALYR